MSRRSGAGIVLYFALPRWSFSLLLPYVVPCGCSQPLPSLPYSYVALLFSTLTKYIFEYVWMFAAGISDVGCHIFTLSVRDDTD